MSLVAMFVMSVCPLVSKWWNASAFDEQNPLNHSQFEALLEDNVSWLAYSNLVLALLKQSAVIRNVE